MPSAVSDEELRAKVRAIVMDLAKQHGMRMNGSIEPLVFHHAVLVRQFMDRLPLETLLQSLRETGHEMFVNLRKLN